MTIRISDTWHWGQNLHLIIAAMLALLLASPIDAQGQSAQTAVQPTHQQVITTHVPPQSHDDVQQPGMLSAQTIAVLRQELAKAQQLANQRLSDQRAAEARLKEVQDALAGRERALAEREAQLTDEAQQLANQRLVDQRAAEAKRNEAQDAVTRWQRAVADKEAAQARKDAAQADADRALAEREAKLKEEAQQQARRQAALDAQERKLADRDKALSVREQALADDTQKAKDAQAKVDRELAQREQDVTKREQDAAKREQALNHPPRSLSRDLVLGGTAGAAGLGVGLSLAFGLARWMRPPMPTPAPTFSASLQPGVSLPDWAIAPKAGSGAAETAPGMTLRCHLEMGEPEQASSVTVIEEVRDDRA